MGLLSQGGIRGLKAWLGVFFFAAAFACAPCLGSASTFLGQNKVECEECSAARQGLDTLMNGDPDEAIKIFRTIEQQNPNSPLGYLLDADATWWKIYLTTADLVDPDVFDVLLSSSSPYDSHFHDLINVAIKKARKRIHDHQDVARNQLYEGLAYALRARFFGLRDSDFSTARAAKRMRSLLLSAHQADPSLADADAGLGLYNYFVDTLPTIIKMLKFLIGLPPGNRELGLSQQQNAADHGDLVRAEAKFYLAKDYSRTSEQQYAKSLQLFQQLANEYPRNLLWELLTGTLQVRLGHEQEGEAAYREVVKESAGENGEVAQALHRAAQEALGRLRGK
jgi:tetratricopeptide (TPR) repeat protein